MNFRPLRGRAVVLRHKSELGEYQLTSGIVVPATIGLDARRFRIHLGKVVALGKPAFEHELSGVERPWSCQVGDEIYFSMALALEKVRAFEDFAGWKNAIIIGQEEIHAVVEGAQ
jgi:co-chaperonin GroES (HSP10)